MKTLQQIWLMLVLAFCLSAGSPAEAAEITVQPTCTLADAITAANNNADEGGCVGSGDAYGDDIILLEVDVTLSKALPQISSTITIEGSDHFISGNHDENVGSVLHIRDTGNLTLNEVTVKDGYTAGIVANPYNGRAGGGGIYNNGMLTLNNSTVNGNSAQANGEVNSEIINNRPIFIGAYGGGIYNSGTVTLTNSTVSRNTVSGVSGNTAVAIMFISSLDMHIMTKGGGIYNSDTGTVTLTNSTVSENSASSHAFTYGMCHNDAGGICMCYTHAHGGGIHNSGRATLNNSTVSENSTYSDSDVEIHTEANNSVSTKASGGGICNSGRATLNNSTVSGNSVDVEVAYDSTGAKASGGEIFRWWEGATITADSYNVFGHSGETSAEAFYGFTPGGSDVNATSDGNKPSALAAILLPLADNGGPTRTHALPKGSPAIDLDPSCSTGLTTDQRGMWRPFNAGCDAGSYELQGITIITLASFTATAQQNGAILKWETDMELINAGFNIWRSETEDGEYIKITDNLIPAQGIDYQYSFTDDTAEKGNTSYYKLEDIDLNGTSTFHGPVSTKRSYKGLLPAIRFLLRN